jgi:hypothetical protein
MVSKIGAHVETIFHIGSCALATSTLTSISAYHRSWLDSWHGIHGFVYITADPGTQDETQDAGKLFTFCVVWACVMNSNVLV